MTYPDYGEQHLQDSKPSLYQVPPQLPTSESSGTFTKLKYLILNEKFLKH